MKKEVLIYLAYAFIGMILAVMIFFGEGRITSLAIFNGQSIGSENQLQNQVERAVVEKEVLLSKTDDGLYVSEVLDSGAESRIRDIELNGNEFHGRLLYVFSENEELLVSSDEGLSWNVVNDPAKIEKMKLAVKKSDLVEDYLEDVSIEIRVCSSAECSDRDFVDLNDIKNLEGRYFQYRLKIENSGGLENPGSISAKVSYETIIEGSQEEESNDEIISNNEENDGGIANNG